MMKRLLLIALLITSMFAWLTPTPAYARHQYLYWDETGDTRFTSFGANATITIASGQIEFVDLCPSDGTNDKIYPASDIYVVPSGDIDVGSELEDVSGTPNTIITGSGGAFIGETIGITGPSGKIGEGTYAIVYDECQDGKVHPGDFVLNPAFAVTAIPADVPPLPSIELEKKLAEIAGDKLDDLHKWLDDYFKAATLADRSNPMSQVIAGLGTKPFLSDPRAVVLLQVANQAKQYKGIAADPPDPQFAQLSPLLARTVVEPHSNDPLLTALADFGTQSSTEGALAEALLRSLERYQGADLEHNGRWALVHARAIRDYALGLQAQLAPSSAALARVDAALAADATPIDALAADAQAFIARVQASGLTAEEIQAARDLGLTDAQVAQLAADIAALDLSTFSKANLQGAIADLQTNNAALADEMSQLATEMAPIITALEADPWTPDEAPQVQAGGPYTGTEGSAITLDGASSTSPSAITTYAWDLDGDGTFDDATGATPAYTYTTPFAGVVGLQATNVQNLSNIAYTPITVTDVNRRPKIDEVSPANRTIIMDAGTAQPFSVAASDPDGDPVSIRWLVDDAAAGTGPAFTYTPAASNLGVRTVEARVTDGTTLGGEVRHRWTVAVLIADGDGDGYRGNVDCDDADPAVNPGKTEVVGNGKDDDCNPTTPDAGTAPVAFFNPDSGGRNVALLEGGATVHAVSSQYSTGYPATTLINYTANDSYWATGNGKLTNQWVKILLADGQPYLIDRVQLRPAEHGGERVQTFAIDVSTTTAEDAAFTTVLEATAADNTTLQEFALPTPVLAKYVRYRPLTNRGSTCCIGTQQLTVLTGQQGGAAVTFKNLSQDGDNNITAYRWDFGDSTTSTEQHPTHTFAGPGTYPVQLTVTDAAGNTHNVTLNQRVFAPPTASFTSTPAQPSEGQAVTFTDTSADPDGGSIVHRSWTWGDPSPSTSTNGPTAHHSFADNGSYVVTLDVIDSQGQTARTQQTVTVANVAPSVNVGADRTWVGERELRFDPTITDPGTDTRTCRWDFGDDSAASTECAFRHTYRYTQSYDYTDACDVVAPPKVFTATLTVTDKDGGVSADSVQITVRPAMIGSPDTIVTNGDFETPLVGGGFTWRPAPGSFDGWTIAFGSIDHISPSYWEAACGGQSVDVTGSETGAMYQDLPTVPGQTYHLRFALAGNPVGGPAVKQLEVGWASDRVDTLTVDATGRTVTSMGWTYHEYMVKATTSVTRLRFTSLTSGYYGPVVDDVSVVPVTIADPNQPPMVQAGGPYAVDEGGTVTVTASGSDPETTPLTFVWDLDHDGTWETSGERVSFAAAERDGPSTHTVAVQATDAGGLTATSEATITVRNVAPTATFAAPADVAEGSALTLALVEPVDGATDLPTLVYAFDCGDGYGDVGASASATCPTDTSGTRTVKGKVQDKDGGVTEYTATVSVTNVAPTATLSAASPIDEGASIKLALTDPADPSSDDTTAGFTYAFDCGSGYGAASSANEAACPTTDSGTRTVTGKIIDQDGGATEYRTAVTITNVAPTATLTAPATVAEGTTVEIALHDASDVSATDTAAGFSYAFDCGDGAGYGARGTTASSSCPTTDNGSRAVSGKVRDKDGSEREYTAAVSVTNVAPSVGPMTASAEPVAVTTAATASAPFADPGTADTHTAVWDWGDGTTSAGTLRDGSVEDSHTYAAPGVYTITLTVTDDDGGAGASSYQYVVVYDPSGGFVTGGGWIDSPPGASTANPDLTGRANFGFVAKYQKGATVPSGQTQFQFKAGDLNFHSTAYEWLVVAGPKAQYKGTGTINGTGSYGFLLTANDGQVPGGGGVDRFRIKIWDTASGAIVYDNQRGTEDDAAATDAIEGGSVVIQSGK